MIDVFMTPQSDDDFSDDSLSPPSGDPNSSPTGAVAKPAEDAKQSSPPVSTFKDDDEVKTDEDGEEPEGAKAEEAVQITASVESTVIERTTEDSAENNEERQAEEEKTSPAQPQPQSEDVKADTVQNDDDDCEVQVFSDT